MEVKNGLSGRILPDDLSDESDRSFDKNKKCFKYFIGWQKIAAFVAAGVLIGFAAATGLVYYNLISISGNKKKSNQYTEKKSLPRFGIELNSDPEGASIYIDKTALSKFTPSSISGIGDGNHILQLFQGSRNWEAGISVKEGRIEKIEAVIPETLRNGALEESGSIFLSSNPAGADIFINNKSIGKITPFEISGLNPGNYLISLKSSEFVKWSEEIAIEKGSRLELSAILEKEISSKDYSVNSGWRSYQNKIYGVEFFFPSNWKISELPKDIFEAAFSVREDKLEYKNAEILIAMAYLRQQEPAVVVAASNEDKASLIEKFSEENFSFLEEESIDRGIEIFESLEKTERFAIIKDSANSYSFIVSFHDFGNLVNNDLFGNFLEGFKILKPEIL